MSDNNNMNKTGSSSPKEKLVSSDQIQYSSNELMNEQIEINSNEKNSNKLDTKIIVNNNENNEDKSNEQKEDTFYTAKAHMARRIYHVIIFTIAPILYLWTAQEIADGINVSVPKILSFLILLAIIIEFIRIKKRWIIFGMREYERDHICAQAW